VPSGPIQGWNEAACDNANVTTPISSGAPSATPTGIHADRAAGNLTVDWADGHRTSYDARSLRWMCPCAFCRGEAGLPGWLDSAPTLTDEQTRLVDVQLVGSYAICPTWGDGHRTGYYSFAMLRARCPCPVCSAAAGAGDPDEPKAPAHHHGDST